ncbi:hypothetical protein [Rhizobacter sp. LjRoot28]|uniref:hypothetical protein n=1 Tax=Rhizobacter sp. LjRoot28 TaxID=3342309 RepID=UPI003ECD7B6F
MNAWECLLKKLVGLNLIAEWRLASGVVAFMAPPGAESIAEDAFYSPGPVSYDELLAIVIRASQPLGGLRKTNDLAAVRALLPAEGVSALDDGESVEFRAARKGVNH